MKENSAQFQPANEQSIAERSKRLRSEEETDISDACSDISSDSDVEQNVNLRKAVTRYEKSRVQTAWRWKWLNLQISELNNQMTTVPEVAPENLTETTPKEKTVSAPDTTSTTEIKEGFTPPMKKRRVGRPRKSDRVSHPLFSMRSERKLRQQRDENSGEISEPEPPTDDEEELLEFFPDDYRQSKKSKNDSLDSPISPEIEGQTPRGLRKSNGLMTPNGYRKRFKEEGPPTGIVIPAYYTVSPVYTPKLPKDIFIPTWHEVQDETKVEQTSTDSKPPELKQEASSTSIAQQLSREKLVVKEISQDDSYDMSQDNTSDEDTSDESYCFRHLNREMLEKKRFLFPCDKNPHLPCAPEFLQVEFFLMDHTDTKKKKKPKTVDPKKIEEFKREYEETKQTYIDIYKGKNWDDMKGFVEELEKQRHIRAEQERLEKERIDRERQKLRELQRQQQGDYYAFEPEYIETIDFNDLDPNFKWEVIPKTQPLDPITNKPRNILYLRRLRLDETFSIKTSSANISINLDTQFFISHQSDLTTSPTSFNGPQTPPAVDPLSCYISTPPSVETPPNCVQNGQDSEKTKEIPNSSPVAHANGGTKCASTALFPLDGTKPPFSPDCPQGTTDL